MTPRTTRGLAAALLGAVTVLAPTVAVADETTAAGETSSGAYDREVDITWPLGIEVSFTDTYDAKRGGNTSECTAEGVEGRIHQASDLLAPQMTPVHAAMGGTVVWAPDPEPSYGWMITIRGDDGLDYSYVHLNNDTPGTTDNNGGIEHAYADGVRKGSRVERGQLIGWVGDSGNATGTNHLHFEIEDPNLDDPRLECPYQSKRMNPYPSLRAALDRGDVPWDGASSKQPAGGDAPLAVPDGWTFADVDPSETHGHSVDMIVGAGITKGCADALYCPREAVTRAQMATFLARAMDLPAGSGSTFTDVPAGSTHAGTIAALVASEITSGCGDGTRFCPDAPVTREQMATFLARALDLPLDGNSTFDDVVAGTTHAGAIAALVEAGVTSGCEEGRYCPGTAVTREQMATFLARAFLEG